MKNKTTLSWVLSLYCGYDNMSNKPYVLWATVSPLCAQTGSHVRNVDGLLTAPALDNSSYHTLLCWEQCQRIKMHNCNLWNGSRGLRLLLSYQFSCCPATKVINSVHKNWAEMVTLSNTCEIDIAAAVDSGHRLTTDHCGNITWSLLFYNKSYNFVQNKQVCMKFSHDLNDFDL